MRTRFTQISDVKVESPPEATVDEKPTPTPAPTSNISQGAQLLKSMFFSNVLGSNHTNIRLVDNIDEAPETETVGRNLAFWER